jgi:hypothetical protein
VMQCMRQFLFRQRRSGAKGETENLEKQHGVFSPKFSFQCFDEATPETSGTLAPPPIHISFDNWPYLQLHPHLSCGSTLAWSCKASVSPLRSRARQRQTRRDGSLACEAAFARAIFRPSPAYRRPHTCLRSTLLQPVAGGSLPILQSQAVVGSCGHIYRPASFHARSQANLASRRRTISPSDRQGYHLH